MASFKNEEGGAQDAAERIKAAALSAAKSLSRAQAERAAARNVNAYGQKEEGPSRWQERKEAKRQMYLMSTEKQQLKNPKLRMKVSISYDLENPDIEKEMKSEKSVKKSKRKHNSDTESGSDSEASVFESDSEASLVIRSDYSSGSDSSYSSTDSEEEEEEEESEKEAVAEDEKTPEIQLNI
ncbi:hypothetical protein T459_17002 [Capsicum annuum]|uniref:Uncharacterized protein n=1 Tax=Capsicum annuum TaxID=4072 RepID=A0A2G2ZAC0_CAPAN|nr:putative outer envelope pore protein 16-2, chloroplastic-like [Capsicum annuum]PHT78950.1 hypothetical protein T459_17002 [Capsicum annuum]